ncbi:isopeptide-forming domain-containing fimbrial protein (plasmid) [Macrococcoides canis]|uniref:isopeptide-forming domain-containing fimbrial protein n=1 Tax=Macrococcoides canis TaxID=1855823 RepID=UPI001F2D0459|nr:isopeptide-forming domain-containing fimbrial protein [Macrococcus canis]UJS29058.1 isopeptide-forming domain-containing fimbrial protein [Macrococcus canis]
MKKNMKKNKIMSTALLTALSTSVLLGQTADAESITKYSKTEVPTATSVASAKYAVIASMTENTEMVYTPEYQKIMQEVANVPSKGIYNTVVEPADSLKGKLGVTYTNVGTFEGKSLDLKMTVMDWKETDIFTGGQNMYFDVQQIGFDQAGYEWVDIKMEYIYSDTGKPATDLTGSYLTINDIDAQQGVGFSDSQLSKISKIYAAADSIVDVEKKADGFTYFQSLSGDGVNPDDKTAMFTALIDGNTLDLRWAKDWSAYDGGVDIDWQNNKFSQFFGYINEKPVRTELLAPAKTVSDSNQKKVTSNALTSISEKYLYTISHTVPAEYPEFFAKSYELKDTVVDGLKPNLTTLKVSDENGKDVTALFDNKSTGNQIVLSAKPTSLADANFYGHDYFVTFDTTVNKDADLSAYYKDGKFTFPNSATVVKDGETKNTNKTSTVATPKATTIDKSVIDVGGKQVDQTNVKRSTDYKYNVDLVVTDNPMLKSLVLSDDLVDELNYVSAKVLDSTGKDITAEGTLTVDETKESVQWTAKDAKKYAGQKLKLEITAQVKKDADLSKYKQTNGTFILPNTASVTVDGGTPIQSDTVKVVVPAELSLGDTVWNDVDKDNVVDETEKGIPNAKVEVKDATGKVVATTTTDSNGKYLVKGLPAGKYTVTFTPPTGYTPVDKAKLTQTVTLDKDNLDVDLGLILPVVPPAPKDPTKTVVDKSVLDANEKEVDETEVKKATDYKYRVNTTITDKKDIKSLELQDDLEDVLEAKTAKVLDKDGKDITAEGTLSIDKEKEIISWKAKEPSKYSGQKLVLEVVAQVKKDADLSKYTDKDGNIVIPNTANVIVDGTTTPSDKVDVTVPKDPSKTVIKKTVSESTLELGQPYNYTVETTITDDKNVKEVTLIDDLEDVLEAKTAKVLDKDGKDITAEGILTIDEEKEIITWKAKDGSKYVGQKLTLAIDTFIKKDADLSKYTSEDGKIVIPNTAKTIVGIDKDGRVVEEEIESNKVDVTTTPKVEEPTTEAPTSEEPTTEAPTTEAPTTEKPDAVVVPTTNETPSTEKPAKPSNELVQSLLPHTGSAQDKTLKTIAYALFATGAGYLVYRYRRNKQDELSE